MAFASLLRHRCTIMRMSETQVNGKVGTTWEVASTGNKCFLDLNFIRKGKDQIWTPEAGRPADRTGVLFMSGTADIVSGDRVRMTTGPSGTFELQSAVDEAWRPTNKHHLELGVKEVSSVIARGYSVESETR